MVKMTSRFKLQLNEFSWTIPTQLGKMTKMFAHYDLTSNKLCSDVPTEVQALSSGVTTSWSVTTGNSIGTHCIAPTAVSAGARVDSPPLTATHRHSAHNAVTKMNTPF